MEISSDNIIELFAIVAIAGYLLSVSIIFWLNDINSKVTRIILSSHGALILIIYIITFVIWLSGNTTKALLPPFWLSLLLPLFSTVKCIKSFTGNKWFHLLHIPNTALLIWLFFVGSMAISNDWL